VCTDCSVNVSLQTWFIRSFCVNCRHEFPSLYKLLCMLGAIQISLYSCSFKSCDLFTFLKFERSFYPIKYTMLIVVFKCMYWLFCIFLLIWNLDSSLIYIFYTIWKKSYIFLTILIYYSLAPKYTRGKTSKDSSMPLVLWRVMRISAESHKHSKKHKDQWVKWNS